MLENMRRQGASIFIYVIFGILILVFIINFRPGGTHSGDDSGGCTGTSNTAITVDGSRVNQTSYKVNYGAFNGPQMARTFRALENLIRREILASEATDHGIRASDDLILDKIKQGYFFLGGQAEIIKDLFREDGTWDYARYKGFVQNQFNVSLNSYQDEQRRELQASLMAQEISDSVRISRDEALSEWLYDNNTVTFDAVVFRAEPFKAAMRLTDADIERFGQEHDAEVKARYQADATLYKGVKPQLKLREIFIKASKPADGAGSGAGSAAGSGATEKVKATAAGMPVEEAKAKLESVREAVAGGKPFIDFAKDLNSDPAMRASGGDLGWRTADSAAIGDKPVTDAIKDLKPGTGTNLTKVIATEKGVYLVIAEDKREGDLSYDQVKNEIAAVLAKDVWSKEAAKRAAIIWLANARSNGGHNLDQLFPRDANDMLPQDIKEILKANPGLTREQIMEELRRLKGPASGGDDLPPPTTAPDGKDGKDSKDSKDGPHGALEVEGPDHPAGWFADADGTPGTPPGGSAVAATGSAPTGSATAGSAAGSAAAAGGGSAVDPIAQSTDIMPKFAAIDPPHVSEQGPMPRTSKAAGIGGKDIIDAAFDQLTPASQGDVLASLPTHIFAGEDNSFVIIQLKDRHQANVADFDKDADHVMAELRTRRSEAAVVDYLRSRCEALKKANRIKANQELVREHDDNGNPLPSGYQPCMSFQVQPSSQFVPTAE